MSDPRKPGQECPTLHNAKGPASVGALPDHDPNNPMEGMAMDSQEDSTAPAQPASTPARTHRATLLEMQDLVNQALYLTAASTFLTRQFVLDPLDRNPECVTLDAFHGRMICAIADVAWGFVQDLNETLSEAREAAR